MTIKCLTNRICLIILRCFVGQGFTPWHRMTGLPAEAFPGCGQYLPSWQAKLILLSWGYLTSYCKHILGK